MRNGLKSIARGLSLAAVSPALISFAVRRLALGPDRAIAGSSEAFARVPGLAGQYLRRALLSRIIAKCSKTATLSFGTILSRAGAKIDDNVYVGPGCFLGLVHIERDVLIGSGVHITSGKQTHGTGRTDIPMRDQEGTLTMVTIGQGAWIGSGAIVMADVGRNSVVGAGSVVTSPIPDNVVAAGVPARVLRQRDQPT